MRITLIQAVCFALIVTSAAAAGEDQTPPIRGGSPGCPDSSRARRQRIDAALLRASEYLATRQSSDGAWRSEVYATFRQGDALTPLVLMALASNRYGQTQPGPIDRAARYLIELAPPSSSGSSSEQTLNYGVYSAALAVMALAERPARHVQPARSAWLAYLRARQLTEPLGWNPDDPRYGGWGYSVDPPRKPAVGRPFSPLAEPNLSATTFALAALRAGGFGTGAPEVQKALRFIRRCQNFADDPHGRDTAFDDGGFYFMNSDAVRNKAGVCGIDRFGRQRYASYGSATADGWRSLVLCGLTPDTSRVAAARQWLARHFSAQSHPGGYVPGREPAREAVFFYYCHSLAECLALAAESVTPPDPRRVGWAAAIAQELVQRQRIDGSWINSAVDVREDDPLLATPLALRALALCRRVIMVESPTIRPAEQQDDRPHDPHSPTDQGR